MPLRSMLKAGLVVAGGSDHMIRFDSRQAINPYNPFFEMWMAITRRLADGTVTHPEQCVTRLEALAHVDLERRLLILRREEQRAPSSPASWPTWLIVSKDFLHCPVDEIKDIEALVTIVDGKEVYKRP